MRIYISGKKEGMSASKATRLKFAKVGKMLEERGFEVVNMYAENFVRSTKAALRWRLLRPNISSFLLICLDWLTTCDAIYMLPDFLDCPAAKVEHAFAIAVGIQVYYDEELYRDGTLRSKAYNKNRLPEVTP